MNLIIDDTDHPLIIKVASIQAARRQVYFIDNDDYFQHRSMTNDENGVPYEDNGERAIFYARGVLETVKKLRWCPDIIHCHGWMSAVVPLYIKKYYNDEPSFRDAKIVYSLYDNEFDNTLAPQFKQQVLLKNINESDLDMVAEPVTHDQLYRLAIAYSDGVIQNSPTIHPQLVEYTQARKLPFIEYKEGDALADACDELYNQILAEKQS